MVYITLNRPEDGNLLNLEMAYGLENACRRITDDEEVLAVLLSGGVADTFCAGEDLEEYLAVAGNDSVPDIGWEEPAATRGARALAGLTKPIVAAINGAAWGAGLELALCCDIRVASENATFALPETSMGLIPHAGGTQRLSRTIGKGKALEMALTGDTIGAHEAYRLGLVSRVVSPSDLLSAAEAVVEKLTQKAPIALQYTKEAVIKGTDVTLEQALRLEADMYFLLQTTEDRIEGIRSFLEKRTPEFKGR
ncbi:MAG: enoyl-CoA hydratase [Dehalococcoidia bacterium]|nr:enoyl-CoA hydratase [Dehalococcoidia bacterium]